jgi:hypothetical protein
MKRDYMEFLMLHVLLTGSYKVIQSYSIEDLASENYMLIESESKTMSTDVRIQSQSKA